MIEVQSRTSCEDLIKEKDKEIERLKKREQECIDHYLVQCKYASEMEGKYITANNIINELEEFIEKKIDLYTVELTEKNKNKLGYTAPIRGVYKEIYNVLQELKGSDKE